MRVFRVAERITVDGADIDPAVADEGREASVVEEATQAGDDLHVLVLLL